MWALKCNFCVFFYSEYHNKDWMSISIDLFGVKTHAQNMKEWKVFFIFILIVLIRCINYPTICCKANKNLSFKWLLLLSFHHKKAIGKVKKICQRTMFGIIMHISCYNISSGNQSSCPYKKLKDKNSISLGSIRHFLLVML